MPRYREEFLGTALTATPDTFMPKLYSRLVEQMMGVIEIGIHLMLQR